MQRIVTDKRAEIDNKVTTRAEMNCDSPSSLIYSRPEQFITTGLILARDGGTARPRTSADDLLI